MNLQDQDNINLAELTSALLNALDARSRDIIMRRYGLKNDTCETLESIGREYGITRERVRQIQTQAKKSLLQLRENLKPVSDMLNNTFVEHGGIMAEEHVISEAQKKYFSETTPALVTFYLDLLNPYQYISRDSKFAPHWRLPDVIDNRAEGVINAAESVLVKKKHPLSSDDLIIRIYKVLDETEESLPQQYILAQVIASKKVQETPFKEWGLIGWPETSPRGVGDKSYAVLRRSGEPQHFTDITKMINEAKFDYKTANAQTVHNELIKDNRFVLVGRGLYGLSEWGYVSGTVADVIKSVLEKADQPLTRDEIIKRVLEQRQVKKNTILLGLQNHSRFTRDSKDRYSSNI